MFDSRMKTTAIPERVYALCRMLMKGPVSEELARIKFEPVNVSGTTPYFGSVKVAAEQLGLIVYAEDEKLMRLNVDLTVLDKMSSFRTYVNKNIESVAAGQFYRTTKVWMTSSDKLFHIAKDDQSVSKMTKYLNSIDSSLSIDEDAMRAWRFWSSFLGFGYLHDMFFLPNAAVFVRDAMINAQMEVDHEYTVSSFIEKLHPYINICINPEDQQERKLNMALSNALRTLNDLGDIELKYVNDRQDEWHMSSIPLHAFGSFITDIKYKG